MYPIAKRVLDILGASLCLIAAAPLLLLVSLALRSTMGSPVLFRHRRPGLGERPVMCLKFRTMTDECGKDGVILSDEQRLTAFGRFLRRTSLDELPQLWNVLKGEMSLVGPRPLEFRYLPRYTPEQRRRHDVLPGITGWAQVHGRNAIEWEQKFALDLWYVENRCLSVDIRILAMTFWMVLTARNITEPGHATASEFWGTHAKMPAAREAGFGSRGASAHLPRRERTERAAAKG
jgi:lipopolysaccharide/colanic/teichoic acid biosynthesis glycosyltransferase